MIPLGDDNQNLRPPLMTAVLLAGIGAAWVFVQGAGFNELAMAASVCDYGVVPGELTRLAPVGFAIPMGRGLSCVVDRLPVNLATPLTSMFLHGDWMHLLANSLYLWVFGRSIEDSMGRVRYLFFYLLCGLAAVGAQVAIDPASPVPMVGASGAISGVMGAYLALYPLSRINVLFVFFIIIRIIPIPAFLALLWWIGTQLLVGLPQLDAIGRSVQGGVAVWAHIGGFVAGLLLVWLFADSQLVQRRKRLRERVQRWGW